LLAHAIHRLGHLVRGVPRYVLLQRGAEHLAAGPPGSAGKDISCAEGGADEMSS
jgi:hypothetical protein